MSAFDRFALEAVKAIAGETELIGSLADYIAAMGAEGARLSAALADLTAERDSETRWAAQYKAERDAAQANCDRWAAGNAELLQRVERLRAERDAAREDQARLVKMLTDLTADRDHLAAELAAIKAEVGPLLDGIAERWIPAPCRGDNCRHWEDCSLHGEDAICFTDNENARTWAARLRGEGE